MRFVFLAALSLAGCATASPQPAAEPPVLHYLRTNRDGSEAEHVVQFRPTPTDIAVYKWVSKCTGAAYVTATMAADLSEGRQFIAGKVARDGGQARFGTLDVADGALVADVTPPGGPRLQARHRLKGRPFLLYDFDLADLNAFLQAHRPRAAFAFALPVIWPSEPGLFRDLGQLRATPAGSERRLGRRTRRFALTVDGPTPARGNLWVDAAGGFIVEAELGLPNHDNYQDFRLRLEQVEAGGQRAFDALTHGHYANCPADQAR